MEKEALLKLQQSLEELCHYSKTFNLNFELETFDVDIDKKSLIGKSELAAEVARQVRKTCTNFGLILDLSHFPLQHEETKLALANCSEFMTHLHIGNCVLKDKNHPAYGDQHPRFGVPGGENDVEQVRDFFAALFKLKWFKNDTKISQGNKPVISFEVKPMASENCDIVLANSIRDRKSTRLNSSH